MITVLKPFKIRTALLQSFIEQHRDLTPPAVAVAPDHNGYHPEIQRVSGNLLRDGHYKQGPLEAYIRVTEEVKL